MKSARSLEKEQKMFVKVGNHKRIQENRKVIFEILNGLWAKGEIW